MSEEIVVTERGMELQPVGQATPMTLIQMAVQQGGKVSELKELFDLQLRWEQNEAKKAFVVALNEFKKNPPSIIKDKSVSFGQGKTSYKHATLDQVSSVIGSALAAVGISHRWETEQMEGGTIRVTCILTHSLGHSERVPLQASPDQSGSKNSIQAVGSTVTYLQRYTLLAATGMATGEADDDGKQGVKGMSAEARADWLSAIDAAPDADKAQELWPKLLEATTAARDVDAHEELKAALAKKLKSFKGKV